MLFVENFFEGILNTTMSFGKGVGIGLSILIPIYIIVFIMAICKNSSKRRKDKESR